MQIVCQPRNRSLSVFPGVKTPLKSPRLVIENKEDVRCRISGLAVGLKCNLINFSNLRSSLARSIRFCDPAPGVPSLAIRRAAINSSVLGL